MIINDIQFMVELPNIIQELQNQLRINDIPLLQRIKETSADVMVSCPYHKDGLEKKPSAGIRKSDGKFHCFACGEIHELCEVISFCFGHTEDYIGAFGWKWLTKNFLTIKVEERADISLDFGRNKRKESKTIKYMPKEKNVTEGELEQYRYIHPYMYERKLTDEIIEMFDVGYDSAAKAITFPVRDVYGNCLFIARRSVNSKFFSYPSGAEKPVYGLYELSKLNTFPKEIIVTESIIDALTCWVYGKYAVALNGTGTALQYKQLNELPCRKLVCGTDNDKAGNKAYEKLKKNIKGKIITRLKLSKDKKDINELSKKEFENLQEIL